MSSEEEKSEESGSGTSINQSSTNIAAISFKTPKFDKKHVKMWLELVEVGFVTSGITKAETKFAHTIQLMQPDQLAFVSDAYQARIMKRLN
ncbi:hypothetical protein BLOT_008450 [Blomia tropicalis]|nr:hypothetical protein BLOT_008450 [Blomia tropicalis]